MCITEEKLVEAYGNSNPHERFLLIYKNYSVFPQLVDCYETGLLNRILFEVEYNRRKKNDDEIWNLQPTTKSINSAKSNHLPRWDVYFGKLSELEYLSYRLMWQYDAIHKEFDNSLSTGER